MSIPREGSRDTDKGILISKYPDWCKTPDKPIPYTIYAKQDDDANTAPTVRLTGKRSHTKGSIITTCHGDEAGIGRGVKSGTKEDVCQPKTWSETVRFEGKNVVRHDDEWFMNNKNTTGKMTYVEDTKIYEPTPPLVKNEEDRYSKQVDVGATQSLVSDELAHQYSNFFYDNSIDNSKGIEVAQATAVPGPLPMPIPPVAMPGSKENQQFVKDMNKAANAANNYLQKLAISLVTAPLVINSNINKITNDTLAKQEYVSPNIQQQRDAATIAEVTKLRAQRAQTANQAIAVTANDDVAATHIQQTNSSAMTQNNVRVTATTGSPPPPNCNDMSNEVREALYANKRAPGETNGYHGFLNRIVEQMCGRSGPGTKSWNTHVDEIKGSQNRVRDKYNEYKKNGCLDSGKLTRNEIETITKLINISPASFQWLGPNHSLCVNVASVIKNGRLSDLLGIIRP